ncbi:uncharacterized protein LOC142771395 isoform X2 [Rhipicephalus microplus]|uniref:uncharacterized protein LOC142771395 isoform X2 n=1 Tax=Rhipicephalus microplus TaxID=6941 RepID=UPI003F6B5FED
MEGNVLATIFVLISMIYTSGADVKQFVGIAEKIWTVKTTNTAHIRCEVDQRVSIGALSVTFNRSYLTRSHRRVFHMRGVFDNRRKNRMTLFYGDTFLSTESMVYMDPGRTCAVFKVESLVDWSIVYYDLRVTNSSINSGPRPNCPHHYNRLAGLQESFIVYTPECQQIA